MPNWCQGTLKVRGEYDKIQAFLSNALDVEVPYCWKCGARMDGE